MKIGNQGNPAEMLEGMELPNGWRVISKVTRDPKLSGSWFSFGYVVEHADGRRGYLKALDYFRPLAQAQDPAAEFQRLTDAFVFERDLLYRCRNRRMSRIVMALDDGTVRLPEFGPAGVVQYLIFELAEGDVRLQMSNADRFDLAWALRSLHHIAVGLRQLHASDTAHQDVKPSNILLFEDGTSSKLGDVGRSTVKGLGAPHDDLLIAGARPYAPPELLFGEVASDWGVRRLSCDLYHLGSMVGFFFTHTTMTALLLAHLDPQFRPNNWTQSYRDVLPYVRRAHEGVLRYVEPEIHEDVRVELIEAMRQLTDPDPHRRGHPRNRVGHGNPYSLERYVSRFDLLARRAEARLLEA